MTNWRSILSWKVNEEWKVGARVRVVKPGHTSSSFIGVEFPVGLEGIITVTGQRKEYDAT